MGIKKSRCEQMNQPRVALLESQAKALTDFLDGHPEGHERAAVVLFRRIRVYIDDLGLSDRYVAVEVIPFSEDWVDHASHHHVAFRIAPLREIFRRCEEEALVFGFAHNHPNSSSPFSEVDEKNERTLLTALKNRNGSHVSFISLLWESEVWHGRVRYGDDVCESMPLRHIAVLSDKIEFFGVREDMVSDSNINARQEAAFGKPFVSKLSSLRVSVVGCGGTGSAVATLLARAGVGELVLIDADSLESSNLNRVRGARVEDVGSNKASILKDFIRSLGLPCEVTSIQSNVDSDPTAVDALSSSDVVFGCTDDQIGRELINVATYFYSLVLIDLGLGGRVVDDKEGRPILRHHHARISTIFPEYGECLFCQDVIRQEWIQHQFALRENPQISEEEAKERYLTGGVEEAPGVAPFTGAAADFAVANLFELLRSFRRIPGNIRKDFYCLDFINMEIRSSKPRNNDECPYCGERSFLLKSEQARLDRPALGERNEYY